MLYTAAVLSCGVSAIMWIVTAPVSFQIRQHARFSKMAQTEAVLYTV